MRCDVMKLDHVKAAPKSCKLDYGHAFGMGIRGKARRLCHGDTAHNPDAAVLPYGKTKRYGKFTCSSDETRGMRCTSPSGHGFELSRQRQKLW